VGVGVGVRTPSVGLIKPLIQHTCMDSISMSPTTVDMIQKKVPMTTQRSHPAC
jgi:hypothetical protein